MRMRRNPKKSMPNFNEVFHNPDEDFADIDRAVEVASDWNSTTPKVETEHYWCNEERAVKCFEFTLSYEDLLEVDEESALGDEDEIVYKIPREKSSAFEKGVSSLGRHNSTFSTCWSVAQEEGPNFVTVQVCIFKNEKWDKKVKVFYFHIIPKSVLFVDKCEAERGFSGESYEDGGVYSAYSKAFSESVWIEGRYFGNVKDAMEECDQGDGDNEEYMRDRVDSDFGRSACTGPNYNPLNIGKEGFEDLAFISSNWKKLSKFSKEPTKLASALFAVLAVVPRGESSYVPDVRPALQNLIDLLARNVEVARRNEECIIDNLKEYAREEPVRSPVERLLGFSETQVFFSPLWVEFFKETEDATGDVRHAFMSALRLNVPLRYLREKFRGSRVLLEKPVNARPPIKFFVKGDETPGNKFVALEDRNYSRCRTWYALAEAAYREFYSLATEEQYEKEESTVETPSGWDRIESMEALINISRKYGWCAGSKESYRRAFREGSEFYVIPNDADYGVHDGPVLAMYDPESGECEEAKTPGNLRNVLDEMPNLYELEETDEEDEEE